MKTNPDPRVYVHVLKPLFEYQTLVLALNHYRNRIHDSEADIDIVLKYPVLR